MESDYAIIVNGVSKCFNVKKTTKYGGQVKSGVKQVLKNISFSVKKGEVFGLIGRNGSGKSTILKILSGIICQDEGSIDTYGKVASILELSIGFDPELSGRENIYLRSKMYGLSNSEIDSVFEEIVSFSELGEQIDYPYRTYSSGMAAKLAFALILHVKCDILILDEALSVGDVNFNTKCQLAFNRYKTSGKTIIIASHNMSTLEKVCDRILWVECGIVKEINRANTVCGHYIRELSESIDILTELAKDGDIKAQKQIGDMYRTGTNVTKNIDVAKQWYNRASTMGSVDATVALADVVMGEGDVYSAIKLYKKASIEGNQYALQQLVSITCDQNQEKELENALYAEANRGSIRTMILLSDLLHNGIIVKKNIEEAFEWRLKAATAGNSYAQLQIGLWYRDGVGVAKDIEKAISWLTLASENGLVQAKAEMGKLYFDGIHADRDISKSLMWYEKAANAGHVQSAYQLGVIFRDGIGVIEDPSISNKWFETYHRMNMASYILQFANITKMSLLGGNRDESTKWYEMAANYGNPLGMYEAGHAYAEGRFVKQDINHAKELLNKSIKCENTSAMLELGKMEIGDPINKNNTSSIELIKKSAKMGNVDAKVELAKLYYEGIVDESVYPLCSYMLELGNIEVDRCFNKKPEYDS